MIRRKRFTLSSSTCKIIFLAVCLGLASIHPANLSAASIVQLYDVGCSSLETFSSPGPINQSVACSTTIENLPESEFAQGSSATNLLGLSLSSTGVATDSTADAKTTDTLTFLGGTGTGYVQFSLLLNGLFTYTGGDPLGTDESGFYEELSGIGNNCQGCLYSYFYSTGDPHQTNFSQSLGGSFQTALLPIVFGQAYPITLELDGSAGFYEPSSTPTASQIGSNSLALSESIGQIALYDSNGDALQNGVVLSADNANYSIAPVPEANSLLLVATGTAFLLALHRKQIIST